eukprot:1660346-Lingulodinium_polyedra.AAC.1
MLQPENGHPGGGVDKSCTGRLSRAYLLPGRCAIPTGGLYWGCATPSNVSGHQMLLASPNVAR